MNGRVIEVLRKSLFAGLSQEEAQQAFVCLDARKKEYKRGEVIVWEGERAQSVGVVISGECRSNKIDDNGNSVLIAQLHPAAYIGVLLSGSKGRISPVTVSAYTDAAVVFISFSRIVGLCEKVCARHNVILTNFIDAIAEKALLLHDRNSCLIKHSVRDKIYTFLAQHAPSRGKSFNVPLDRKAMAEYLNVERSALSRELSRMAHDGVIEYYKSTFRLI